MADEIFTGINDADPFAGVEFNSTIIPDGPQASGRQGAVLAIAQTNPNADLNTILQSYRQTISGYEQMVRTGQEETARLGIAARQQAIDVQNLQRLQFDPNYQNAQGTAAIAAASMQLAQQDLNRQAQAAAERQAVTNIQDLAARGDTTQARILLLNMRQGDANQVIRDMNTRRLVLQREIENAGVRREDQPWFLHVTDFLLNTTPLRNSLVRQGAVSVDREMTRWYDWLAGGERINAQRETLWNMPADNFAEYVRNVLIPNIQNRSQVLGLTNRTQELNILTSLQTSNPAWQTNAFDLLDNLGWLPVTRIARAATIPVQMINNGARRELGALLAAAAENIGREGAEGIERRLGVTTEDVVRNILPSSVNAEGADSAVGMAGDIASRLQETRTLLDDMIPALATDRFATAAEREAAIQATERQLAEEIGREVKDVAIERTQTDLIAGSPVYRTTFTVGRKTGGLYASERSARRAAADMGYPEAEIVADQSGGFAIRITRDVAETGFYTNPVVNSATNWFSRHLLSATATGDRILDGMMQAAGNRRNKVITEFAKSQEGYLRGLPQQSRDLVTQVALLGRNNKTWYTESELHQLAERSLGRSMTTREVEAYQALRRIPDAEYILRNEDLYKNLVIRGNETVSFEGGITNVSRENAIIDRTMTQVPQGDVYDVGNGIHYNSNRPLTPARLAELREQGYYLVTTRREFDLADGTTRKHFLVRRNQLNIEPLRFDQMAYLPGGHTMYGPGMYFVKQTVRGVQADTGQGFLRNPAVHIVGTQAEAKAWAETMEAARQAWVRHIDEGASGNIIDDLEEIFGGRPGFPTTDEFIDAMENQSIKGFQRDSPFEVLYDRQMPGDYAASRRSIYDMVDEDEDALVGYLRTNGRMYYSRKGEVLPDWLGREAPTLDAFRATNEGLLNVANLSSFSDFKESAIERWVNTYKGFIDQNGLPPNASSWWTFMHGDIKQGVPENIRQAGLTQRDIIRRALGWRTEADFQAQHMQRQFENWMMGNDPNSLRHTIGKNTAQWWNDRDPVRAIRSFAVDLKLGMFNIAQLPLQASSMVAAISIAPTLGHGLKAFQIFPMVRWAMARGARPEDISMLVKRGVHTAGGFADEAEFRAFIETGHRSGFFDFANNHLLMNDHGPNAAANAFSNGMERGLQFGRFAWNEGEAWNRSVAWGIAWREADDLRQAGRFATGRFNDPEFLRELQRLSNRYAMSMSNESAAYWQKGILSIPTQFWSYNARIMELMFGGALSRQQRARLIVGQMLMAGTAGFPLTAIWQEWNARATGHRATPDQPLAFAVERGLVDTALYHLFGVDAQVGQRIGTGSWLPDVIKDIFGWSQFGERPVYELLAGAAGGTLGTIASNLVDVARYSFAESGSNMNNPLTREALIRLASNASSLSNAHKAYMIQRYGELISNRGTVLLNNVPTVNAFAQALGFTPGMMGELSANSMNRRERSRMIDEAVNQLRQYRARWTNEPDRRREIEEQVNLYTRMIPEDIRQDAIRRAQSQTDASLYEHLSNQIQEQETNERLRQELENNAR